MKTKDLIFFFLKRGAVIYTAISLSWIVLALILGVNNKALDPIKFLLMSGLAYSISLGTTLYKIDSFSVTVGRILHALCYIIGFFGFIFFIKLVDNSDITQNLSFALIATAIFAIIYAAVCIIFSVLSKKTSIFSLSSSKSIQTKPNTIQASKKNDNNKKNEKNNHRAKKSKREDDTYTSRFS